uniref:Putative terminase n=2 Tax=viral metagenome TaxID=1070528 RepID=A0A6H1ZI75_9ZZZZ
MNEQRIHWKPHPGVQEDCLAYEEIDEKLYGGGRGGGKTDVGMVWMVHPDYVNHSAFRGLVIRRNSIDLSDWADRARVMYEPLRAVVTGNPVTIEFPTGAKIRTGHLKDADSYTKYQGHEYQRVLIEEASHIPSEDLYEKLLGSKRSKYPELIPRAMLTSNPDGDGRVWLKKRFRIKPVSAAGKIQHFKTEDGETRMYIHSTLDDNPTIQHDEKYKRFLLGITDPDLRKAWRQGDWDSFSVKGSYYGDSLRQMKAEGRILAFNADPQVPVYTYWDLGIGDSMVILFIQYAGNECHLVDLIEMTGEGLEYYAREILNKPFLYGGHFLPHDAKARELGTGKSREEVLKGLLPHSITVLPALGVDDGIQAVRSKIYKLWINERKCQRVVDAIEIYRKEWIEELQTFKDKPVHDWSSHICDALRMWAIAPEPSPNAVTTVSRENLYSTI